MPQTLYASFADPEMAEKAAGALLDHGVRDEDLTFVAGETYAGGRYTDLAPAAAAPMTGAPYPVAATSGPAYGGGAAYDAATAGSAAAVADPLDADDADDVGDNPVDAAKYGVSTTTGADAAAGAVKGAAVGFGVGALAALASLFVPGFGLVAGGGALASALAGAAGATAAGAASGGVVGYLKDQGVPEHAATAYHEAITGGGAMIAVRLPSGDCDEVEARAVLEKYGATNLGGYGAGIGGGIA